MSFEFDYPTDLTALEMAQMKKDRLLWLVNFVMPWICLSLAIVLILLAILAAINKTPFVGIILTFVVPIIFFLFLYRNLGSGENSRVKKLLLDGGKLDIRFSMPYLSKAFLPRDIHEVYLVPKKSLVPEAVKICEKHSLFPFYLYYMSGGANGGPSKTRYLLFLPEKHKEELLAFRK